MVDHLRGLTREAAFRVRLTLLAARFRGSCQKFSQQDVLALGRDVGELDCGKRIGLGHVPDTHCLVDELLYVLQQSQLDHRDSPLDLKRHLLPVQLNQSRRFLLLLLCLWLHWKEFHRGRYVFLLRLFVVCVSDPGKTCWLAHLAGHDAGKLAWVER